MTEKNSSITPASIEVPPIGANQHSDEAKVIRIAGKAAAANQSQVSEKKEPMHRPFSWLVDGVKNDQHARFAAMTMDICQGVETCLELVHTSTLDRYEDAPILGAGDTDRLLRMAMASIRLLGESAESTIDNINDHAMNKRGAPECAA